MTLVAGAYSLSGKSIPESITQELVSQQARPGTTCTQSEMHGKNFFLVKADIGAYDDDGLARLDSGFAMVMGDPILKIANALAPRRRQAQELAEAVSASDFSVFQRARGTYSFAKIGDDGLTLATDHCGVRPLYYALVDETIYFSSTLRVLRSLAPISNNSSLPARGESALLRYPLADRTQYEQIFRMREAEILTIRGPTLETRCYWDWSEGGVCEPPYSVRISTLYDTFRQGVRLRAHGDTSAYSFLSGGLDSRATVAALVDEGLSVHAINCSPVNTQDRKYAELFANEVDGRCWLHQMPLEDYRFPHWSNVAAKAISALSHCKIANPEHPKHIWSGDGGSVGLGHVYLDESTVNHLRRGDYAGAVTAFLSYTGHSIPASMLRHNVADSIRDIVYSNIEAEMRRVDSRDPGRNAYFFLMFNDQRRHLSEHYEDIDLHGIEFQLPFFDAEFLKSVVSLSIDECLRHKAYMHWFDHFPKWARSTPWQTYPGHVPCPIGTPGELDYQWDSSSGETTKRKCRNKQANALLSATFDKKFEHDLFRTNRVRAAALAHWLGIGDYTYVLELVHALTPDGIEFR